MSDQILISQTQPPTARQTAAEPLQSTLLPDGALLQVQYQYGPSGDPYGSDSIWARVINQDGSLRSERELVGGDPSLQFGGGLIVGGDGMISVYNYPSEFGASSLDITPVAANGTFGVTVHTAASVSSLNFINVVPRNDGGFVTVSNGADAANNRTTVFAPFNADGTAANPPAIFTGADSFSLIGAQFVSLADGRNILLLGNDVMIMGPGGFPGDPQRVANTANGEVTLGGRALVFEDGRIGLLGTTSSEVDYVTTYTTVLQIIGPGGGLQGTPVDLASVGRTGGVLDVRLQEDGTIALLTGTARTQVDLVVVRADGTQVSTQTVYSATEAEAGRTIAEDITNDFSAIFRNDGGFVVAGPRAGETRDVFFLQNFTADGRADGVPIMFDERAWYARESLLQSVNGDLWFSWDSALLSGTEGIRNGHSIFNLITPRALGDEANEVTLDMPEAVDGGAGADEIFGSAGIDRLLGGAGNDLLVAGAGDDLLRGDAGNDTLDGGIGDADTAFYQGSWQDYALSNTSSLTITGLGAASGDGTDQLVGIERLVFADRAVALDVLLAEAAADFNGTSGPDQHIGGTGSNRLSGFGGNDTLDGGSGADTIIGGPGDDVLIGGTTQVDLRDLIFGGDGHDSIRGGYGNDELRGDGGNDTIEGGFGADTVIGGTGEDVLTGGAFGDVMFGGDGADYINGGFGSDRVNGGAGADRFFHLGIADHGNDWVQDYNAAEGDVLIFGGNAGRTDFQVNTANTPSAGAGDVSESFIIYRPTGQILWALVDGAGQDAITLRLSGGEFDLLA